mgnify:CR=1 FL=1
MKRFLIPLFVVLAFPTTVEANWFGYGSSYEAMRACRSWENKETKRKIRFCIRDPETDQVLGEENGRVKKRYKY